MIRAVAYAVEMGLALDQAIPGIAAGYVRNCLGEEIFNTLVSFITDELNKELKKPN